MARRKAQAAELHFGPALKALLICLLIGGTALGYVRQCQEIDRLSRRHIELSANVRELARRNREYAAQITLLTTDNCIRQELERLNLELVRPRPGQIHILHVPARRPAPTAELADASAALRTPRRSP